MVPLLSGAAWQLLLEPQARRSPTCWSRHARCSLRPPCWLRGKCFSESRRCCCSDLSSDYHVRVLSALSGYHRLRADVPASLLAATSADCGATAKYLADHPTRSRHARLVVRWRNVSALIFVRRGPSPCWCVDDFPEAVCARTVDPGRLTTH